MKKETKTNYIYAGTTLIIILIFFFSMFYFMGIGYDTGLEEGIEFAYDYGFQDGYEFCEWDYGYSDTNPLDVSIEV